MLAIQTRYLGPTTYRPSRILARVMEPGPDCRRKVTVPYDAQMSETDEDSHKRAIRALLDELGWGPEKGYRWVIGSCVGGYVAVCDTRHRNAEV